MSDARHLADVICGECGNVMRIALGMAHAIVCGECKTEIVLGEYDSGDFEINGQTVAEIDAQSRRSMDHDADHEDYEAERAEAEFADAVEERAAELAASAGVAELGRVLDFIIDERAVQEAMYDWSTHTAYHKALAVSCEAMEAAQCVLKNKSLAELRTELVQTAAIAIRWLQELEGEEP